MTDQAPKTSRWVKITLFVSLALNLAVAGMVVGHFAGGGSDRGRPPTLLSGSGPFLAAMPPEARRDFMRDVRGRMGNGWVEREGRRAAVRRMAEIIRADPFDPASLTAELAVQQEFAATLTGTAQEAMVDWVASLPDEERQHFAERLIETARDRGRR